jgi:hypothetical protein
LSGRPAAEDGAAAQEVRDARAIGPHSAIDQFEKGNIVPRVADAPAALLTSIATNGATAFLIIIAMTFGLIVPRMLFERVLLAPA